MSDVFLLHHVITRSEDDINHKIIGVYDSEEQAKAAIERLKNKPGFRDPRGEFIYGQYTINQDHFGTGFGLDKD